ncbi:MAG: 4-hydroxythreonine-4-phosphate dehydrogenase PdxA [Bdellovibrionaceae bacterium]|nr:4-hydroxythreonine-4-phosphate dehydrogenase PdxA [Bdellovibrio sp.]
MPTLKSKAQTYKKIAITTGDPRGVGFEVAAKALAQLAPTQKTIFFLFRDVKQEKTQAKYFKLIDSRWTRLTFYSLKAALDFVSNLESAGTIPKNILIDLALKSSAAEWVFEASRACLAKTLHSLVTGPLSKTLIKTSGYSEIGHTGIFRTLCPNAQLHMAFIGKDFNVLLATDHIPFAEIEKSLTNKVLTSALKNATQLKMLLNSKKDIGVLGLNPHAGEADIMGKFESKILKPLPKGCAGPLIPDAAFLQKNWNKYSLFLCLYHDQGLIPFKMHHGQDSGVHITMGLPFIRTSVDHGTAIDIYNKNIANPNSMLDAINLNLKLLGRGA